MRRSSCWTLPIMVLLSVACHPSIGEGSRADPGPEEATQVSDSVEAVAQVPSSLEGDFLYKVVMLRASPGRLPDLIELLKEERDLLQEASEPLPFWMRHTQGDQWDLFILYPMGDFHGYFEPGRVERRLAAGTQKGLSEGQLRVEADLLTSWRDEMFVRGPEPDVLESEFGSNSFYHVEMFVALPTRRRELLQERRMENHYSRLLGRPQNLIFTREAGGPWDSFTLGFYRDLKHFAESADLSLEARERAAVEAGFQGADQIGSFLRRFILLHRDTLCVAIE